MPAYSMGKSTKQRIRFRQSQPVSQLKIRPQVQGSISTQPINIRRTDNWSKVSRIKTSPSSSMPKTKKFFDLMQKFQDNTGPGSYNPQKPHMKLIASMKGRPVVNYKTQSPSPANYNTDIKFTGNKYSFGRSTRKFKTQQGPGPANYTLNVIEKSPAVQFGKQQRCKTEVQNIPGPGSYAKAEAINNKNDHEYSFAKGDRFMADNLEEKVKGSVPGPGSYSIGNFRKTYKGGKFTYGDRSNKDDKKQIPGPGAYEPQFLYKSKNHNAIIGTQKRQTFKQSSTPGPGAYDSSNYTSVLRKDGTAVFTHDQRLRKQYSKTPGPGSYDAKPCTQSRAVTITTRHKQHNKDKIPGPQDYNPDYKKIEHNPGNPIFGSQKRLKQDKPQIPGPGQYQAQKYDQSKHSKTFYFNRAKSADKMSTTVGPGQYKLKPYIGTYDGLHKDNKEILFV